MFYILIQTPKVGEGSKWEVQEVETLEEATSRLKEALANGKQPKLLEDIPFSQDIKIGERHSYIGKD